MRSSIVTFMLNYIYANDREMMLSVKAFCKKTMPKTILYIASSLDGYIAGKDDDLSWLGPFQDVDYDFAAFFSKIGAIIEGRRTYQIFGVAS